MKTVFDYLSPAQEAVVEGLEDKEKIYALEQAKYLPIRTLKGENGNSAIYRCAMTPEQRQMIVDGADILIEIVHFGGPLAPSRVMLLNQAEVRDEDKTVLANWFAAQVKMP